MIFDVAYLIWHLSQYTVLEPGDLINTGTPQGVALSGRFPYLAAGDVVEIEIDGLGRQRSVVEGRCMIITAVDTYDIRFPTSRELDGSDAMNPDPDYSAAYVVLRTDSGAGRARLHLHHRPGQRGVPGRDRRAGPVRRRPVRCDDLGEFAKRLTHDSQLRWLGPEKGVMHLAAAAVINAAWDLAGKVAGKPVWRLLSEMSPEQLVDLVDWRYLTDALTPDEALDILARGRARPGRADRASSSGAATRRTPPRRAGSATTTPSWSGWPSRRSPTATARSS